MEMDCNLKKLAIFFQVHFLCIIEKSLKPDYSLFLTREILSYFLPSTLIAIPC